MRLLHRVTLCAAIALCCGLALGALARPASAADAYDPAIEGIDRICNGYVASAAAIDLTTLARIPGHDGSVPVWRPSDPVAPARAAATPDFEGGDFATAIFDHGSIVSADITGFGPQGTAKQTRAWCFIGGKLSRATIEIFDADTSSGWRRRLYYGDDLTKPVSEQTVPTGRYEDHPREKQPSDRLLVDAFATPFKLPFYEPAVAAHVAARHRST